MKKGVGSIIQRYGSGDPEPDPHQNVTDPQYWSARLEVFNKLERNRREKKFSSKIFSILQITGKKSGKFGMARKSAKFEQVILLTAVLV
jgi:hypothetical protein